MTIRICVIDATFAVVSSLKQNFSRLVNILVNVNYTTRKRAVPRKILLNLSSYQIARTEPICKNMRS
jgi:hypothetical protein